MSPWLSTCCRAFYLSQITVPNTLLAVSTVTDAPDQSKSAYIPESIPCCNLAEPPEAHMVYSTEGFVESPPDKKMAAEASDGGVSVILSLTLNLRVLIIWKGDPLLDWIAVSKPIASMMVKDITRTVKPCLTALYLCPITAIYNFWLIWLVCTRHSVWLRVTEKSNSDSAPSWMV